MRTSHSTRSLAFLLSGLLSITGWAQPRALPCFFSADFESVDPLSGWDIGPLVERRSSDGIGLGEFVPAWSVGAAIAANSHGYFPVADHPFGNLFVMVNDDAAPCNCDMPLVALTTPVLDLGGRTGVALECRVFNEGTLGAAPATVEVNTGGDTWSLLATLPNVVGEWQNIFIDLSAFDGQANIRLRFNWGDGGGWSSGFALDDLCIRERLAHDFTIVDVLAHDVAVAPFVMGDQSLRYRQLPLEQAGPLIVTVEVKNSGTDTLRNVGVSASLFQNGNNIGPFEAVPLDSLLPGERAWVRISTGWEATEVGELDVFAAGGAGPTDDDANDNSGLTIMQITGPGWDNGYSAMACDNGLAEGAIRSEDGIIAANRMEIIRPGSTATGISAQFGTGTQLGEEVRAILMDMNFSLLDTSARRAISQEDLDAIWGGAPLYFPLTGQSTLPVGDLFTGIQHLRTGSVGVVEVAVGGSAVVGGSTLQVGNSFTLSFSRTTPMVRLHLSAVGVGIHGPTLPPGQDLHIYPVPAVTTAKIDFELAHGGSVEIELIDGMGRLVRKWSAGVLPGGKNSWIMDVSDLDEGSYTAVIRSLKEVKSARIHVVH